jgi:hypothetical protein
LPGVPAAQAQTPGSTRLELVTVSDGTAYHKWSDNSGASWSFWTPLVAGSGTRFRDTPAVVSDGSGRLNVFATDFSTTYIWQNRTLDGNGSWLGWTKVPGQTMSATVCDAQFGCFVPVSAPAVASWGPGRMDLFVLGSNAQNEIALLHTWADNYSWSGTWKVVIGGPWSGAPAAVSSGPGRLDFFTRSYDAPLYPNGRWPDRAGWHHRFDNGVLGDGAELGGILTSPPAVASPGLDLLSVYTRGTDGYLWGINFNGGWSSWYQVGCCLGGDSAVRNSVAAVAQGLVEMDVFVIGTQHDLYLKRYIFAAQGWLDWQYLDHAFNYTNIAAAKWVPIAPPSGGDPGCRHC